MKTLKYSPQLFLLICLVWITFFFIDKTSSIENNFNKRNSPISKTSADVETTNENSIEIDDLQKITGEIVTKNFDGSYMNPLITVSELKPNFYFELNGVNEESKVVLTNPNTGENFELHLNEDGKYILDQNLEENVTYAILLNNNLTGALTIVPKLDDVYDASLYMEVMQLLQCGL